MRTTDKFDHGIESAILHLVFGAIFGAVIFVVIGFWWLEPTFFWRLTFISAVTFGIIAAIWRNTFWSAIANNPLFFLWRVFFGGR